VPRWSDGTATHSGYNANAMKDCRIARFGEKLSDFETASRLSRKAIHGVEERGSCRRTTFEQYCRTIERDPSDFDIVEAPNPVLISPVSIIAPLVINFRPELPALTYSDEDHLKQNLRIILCKTGFRLMEGHAGPVTIASMSLRSQPLGQFNRRNGRGSNRNEDLLLQARAQHWASLSSTSPHAVTLSALREQRDAKHFAALRAMWNAECAPPWAQSVLFNPETLDRARPLLESELSFRQTDPLKALKWGEFLNAFSVKEDRGYDDREFHWFLEGTYLDSNGVERSIPTVTLRVQRSCFFRLRRAFDMRMHELKATGQDAFRHPNFVQIRVMRQGGRYCGGVTSCISGQIKPCMQAQ
jgi:hypothetical protein